VFGFPLLFCFAFTVCLGRVMGGMWWVVGGVVWGLGPWPRPLPVAPVIVA